MALSSEEFGFFDCFPWSVWLCLVILLTVFFSFFHENLACFEKQTWQPYSTQLLKAFWDRQAALAAWKRILEADSMEKIARSVHYCVCLLFNLEDNGFLPTNRLSLCIDCNFSHLTLDTECYQTLFLSCFCFCSVHICRIWEVVQSVRHRLFVCLLIEPHPWRGW